MEASCQHYVAAIIFIITFLLGLPANLFVLFVYVRKARKRGTTPNMVYAFNLCIANLLLLMWLPIKTTETVLQDWTLPELLCPIYSFFFFSTLYGSCLFITAVTVGRYLSVAFPIIYKRYRRTRFSCLISAALWVVVFLHLAVVLVIEKGDKFVSVDGNTLTCYHYFNESQLDILLPLRLEMAVVMFILPLIMTLFCTVRCIILIWRTNLRPLGKRRVLTVAMTTLIVFVVCYAPYNASHIVGFVQKTSVDWRLYALLMSSCNVFLDPVVMLMLSPAASRGLLGRMCGRQSLFSQTDGFRNPPNSANAVANTKGLPTMSERSQGGAHGTKVTHD